MTVNPPHPRVADFIQDELMAPMGWTCTGLAKATGLPAEDICQVVAGRRAVTPGMDRRLCRYFSMPDGHLLRLQRAEDLAGARDVRAAGTQPSTDTKGPAP